MSPRPEYSPAMLALFLRARAVDACAGSRKPAARAAALARCKADLRRMAKLTVMEFDFAWMGRLLRPEPRARLWAVLGHHPSDHGIVLTQGGQEAADG